MLLTFEGNYQFLGDQPFVVYFDFETTAGSDLFQDKEMYVISYCLVFAFHPKLDIERILVYRILQQNQQQLFDSSHLKLKMLQFVDSVTLNKFKDKGLKVYGKKSSFALSEMSSVELKFTIDLLLKWFYSLYKMRFLELDTLTKQNYEKSNKTDWTKTTCCICDFKLSLGASYGPGSKKMTYLDFAIKKEYLFLRNLYDQEILNDFKQVKKIMTYYENFKEMLNCCVLLDKCFSLDSDIEGIDYDCIEVFLRIDLNNENETFEEFYETINQLRRKTITKKHASPTKTNCLCLSQHNENS